MHFFRNRKRSFLLLIVSVWLAFAPGLFELQRAYADETGLVYEPATTEGELSDLISISNDLVTTTKAIEQFNQAMFNKEEIEPEDVLEAADGMLGQILLKSYISAEYQSAQEIDNFYNTLKDVLLGVGNLAKENKSYSGDLSTILTWGKWLKSGENFSNVKEVKVNIAAKMIKGLSKLANTEAVPERSVFAPVRHMLQNTGEKLPILRTSGKKFVAAVPSITKALDNVNKILGPIGFLIDSAKFVSNNDVQAGVFSYESLDSGVSMILSGMSLAFACFPPAALIVSTIGLFVFGAKLVIGALADHYERKMSAYKASFDFLMATDPEFPLAVMIFREYHKLDTKRKMLNRYYLQNHEKLTSFILSESGDTEDRLAENEASNQRILERYKTIWSSKAELLASRRNWQDSSDEGFFTDLIGSLLPQRVNQNSFYLFMGGKERKARREELDTIFNDFHPLVANPDFALIVLFDNYAEYGQHQVDENRIQFLLERIKQNPFSFPYMLEIPQSQYSKEILDQAILVDSINIGWLELCNNSEIIQNKADEFKENLLEEEGAVRTLNHLFLEASTMGCCTRFLTKITESLAEDEESELDLEDNEYLESAGIGLYLHGDEMIAYLDQFTDEELVSALDGKKEIKAKELFELSAFQDAVKNFSFAAAIVNANYFAIMQESEILASQYELMFARLSQMVSQAKASIKPNDEAIAYPKIKEFYKDGKYLGEKEGGFLGFVSGLTPLKKRYKDEVARFELAVKNLGEAFFQFRQNISTREKTEEILDNIRQQLTASQADFPKNFNIDGARRGVLVLNDRTEKVVEYQQQLKGLLDKLKSVDCIEVPVALDNLAEEIYLNSDFELKEYSLNAVIPALEDEN
jgi:hypothetical protein